ncbi:enoyl-CoA hydratase/isomerase family protein [Pseudonocardia thermophila]|uniref:enoyl-CoA hydratase/isomerase family protein n=1 Tax=Pseudonocardia thermophila TaxID=1848 RepID=UPI00248DEF72|nr:enoyl-CoA hydratase-related protein [Pseudonocardia thermophila]
MSGAMEKLGIEKYEVRGECLMVGSKGHTAVVLLDRPQVGNAFNTRMKAELTRLWPELDTDPDIRVIVVGSTSERFFCTGRDVTEVAETGTISSDVPFRRTGALTNRHAEIWTPVVCAVEGKTIGGGLHFVVDADIVVAGSTATFMDTHVNVGLVGALENLGVALKAGLGAALYLTLLGRGAELSAAQAQQLGLVQEVVEAGSALTRAMELAEIIARNSPSAVSRSLEAIWGLATMGGYEQALQQGWLLLRRQWDHPDSKEGPRAWAERREPRWSPR